MLDFYRIEASPLRDGRSQSRLIHLELACKFLKNKKPAKAQLLGFTFDNPLPQKGGDYHNSLNISFYFCVRYLNVFQNFKILRLSIFITFELF
jgi:hypothetical protein